jgi:hypothetical protein
VTLRHSERQLSDERHLLADERRKYWFALVQKLLKHLEFCKVVQLDVFHVEQHVVIEVGVDVVLHVAYSATPAA